MEQLISNIIEQGYAINMRVRKNGTQISFGKASILKFQEGDTALEALQKAWAEIQEIER